MNRFYLTIFFLLSAFAGFASHIVGGEMIYEYLGPGASANTKSFRITLRLFRDQRCTGCAAMPGNVDIGIFSNDDGSQYPASGQPYLVDKKDEQSVNVVSLPPCITNPPTLDYHVATFELTVDLPNNQNGYTAAYQTCCRVNPLANVFNTTNAGGTGSSYACFIPGTNQLGTTGINNSPQFAINISVICRNKPFTLDFSAKDPDGDVLVYSFCDAFSGGAAQGSNNINPAPPPYQSVPYINGFSEGQPLGSRATIDSRTGIISGVAPGIGKYVVGVCITEYRNGKQIGTHRKDFIVNVNDCDFAGAELQPSYITCDGYSYTFQNLNTSPLNKTYYWDFGDNTSSTNPVATHTYATDGTYTVQLFVNKGQSCSGTATSIIKLYPGFQPGFTTKGICINKPTQFTDTTKSVYGVVNYWNWSFDDGSAANNASTLQNPAHTYSDTGSKNVQFIVGDTRGCMDTIYKQVSIIDKPPLKVAFTDTLICLGDQVQLQATGNGDFSWTPASNITYASTATPTVSPATTTDYIVLLDDSGCKNRDTVQVRVVDHITLQVRSDTTICATDPVLLQTASDAFHYQWTPAQTLNDPQVKSPVARPVAATTYQVTAYLGGCSTTGKVSIRTVPYPGSNAGPDTAICYGASAQLNGSIAGSSFVWYPPNDLSNINILNPVATPKSTTSYILIAKDTLGCPKPGYDTVTVVVLPKVNAFAGDDTLAVVGQPLQLLATGGETYLWQPGTSLSNANIANPVAVYDGSLDSIQYKVFVGDTHGCLDSALVTVRIFQTNPKVFVPTAFTPNGDGRNDVIRPIAVGITKIEYFRIYNRWGELVFSTFVNEQGWDGKINGKPQPSGTYVWVVKAVDFSGKEFFAKGTVTLIR